MLLPGPYGEQAPESALPNSDPFGKGIYGGNGFGCLFSYDGLRHTSSLCSRNVEGLQKDPPPGGGQGGENA